MEDCNKRKVLLFTFQNLKGADGITKKIISQRNAFINNGYNCLLGYLSEDKDGNEFYLIENQKIENYKKGLVRKIKKRIDHKRILHWIKSNLKSEDFIYVRYTQFSNNNFVRLFKKIDELKIKIYFEIPTYPYDSEIIKNNILTKYINEREKRTRERLVKYVEAIITYSPDKKIWGKRTINIYNSIDLTKIPISNKEKNEKIIITGVASLAFWHGYDRVITGIYHYKMLSDREIQFNIIGGDENNPIYNELKNLTEKLNLTDSILFHGYKNGTDLDKILNNTDLAIGCLGCHRKNLDYVQSIKNVEYAARGIPFLYSETNPIFDRMPYVIKAPATDEPINIKIIENYLDNTNINHEQIRDSIKELTWDKQMKIIIDDYIDHQNK